MTLIELLVCIAVVAILASLLIVGIPQIRQRAYAATSLSNLLQIGITMDMYASDNDNNYPTTFGRGDEPGLTWMAKLAPLLGIPEDALGSPPKPRSIGIFIDPAHDPERIRTRNVSYALNYNIPHTTRWNFSKSAVEFPERTILIGEIDANTDTVDRNRYLVNRHVGNSGHLLFADGHVERLPDIDQIPYDDDRWWPQPGGRNQPSQP